VIPGLNRLYRYHPCTLATCTGKHPIFKFYMSEGECSVKMKHVKITELSLHVLRLCLLVYIVEIIQYSTLWLQLAKQVVRMTLGWCLYRNEL